jgi:hypothetical protein
MINSLISITLHLPDLYIAFFHTSEFYVILTVVAAAIIAYFARPAERGRAETKFATGAVITSTPDTLDSPRLDIRVADDGAVILTRSGIDNLRSSSTVALAITVIGFDLEIHERTSGGSMIDDRAYAATFRLDFLAPERYHIKYIVDSTQLMTAFSLHVRPSLRSTHALKQ